MLTKRRCLWSQWSWKSVVHDYFLIKKAAKGPYRDDKSLTGILGKNHAEPLPDLIVKTASADEVSDDKGIFFSLSEDRFDHSHSDDLPDLTVKTSQHNGTPKSLNCSDTRASKWQAPKSMITVMWYSRSGKPQKAYGQQGEILSSASLSKLRKIWLQHREVWDGDIVLIWIETSFITSK